MMSFWRTLLPRSITTQITIIVAVSVVFGVALVVGVILFFFEGSAKHKPPVVSARIGSLSLMVESARSADEAEAIVGSARRTGLPVRLAGVNDLEMSAEASVLSVAGGLLAEKLESSWGIDVIENARLPDSDAGILVVRVGEYGVLIFDVSSDTSLWHYLLPPTMLTLAIVLVFVTLLSVYAIRWIIAPLRALAIAAHSFGRSPDDKLSVNRAGPQEITRVADALGEMRTRIRALIDDRTRMLTAISHDLYTPLTRLGLRAERIADPDIRKGVQHEVQQITRMLDETLEYLREDVRSEVVSKVDLPSILQTICVEFSDVGHDVSYEGPARLTLSCRAGVLSRAISNIVDNAVKHGSAARVRLRTCAENAIEIDVEDNGPGIDEALRQQVFDPFVKGDDARNPAKRNGFGLGLSIARDVVRGHGGEIVLLDRTPHGLIVRLSLPGDAAVS